MAALSYKEKARYNRHEILSDFGIEGQEKLKNAKILIVGVGGLGSPLALYLSAAGIGTIGLMDDDVVSETNLQRQVLYNTHEIGNSKVEVAEQKLQALNPYTEFHTYAHRLTEENATEIISRYDIVVDACDNLTTRYTMNKACLDTGKVYVYGAIQEYNGQVSVFNYKGGPDYETLFPWSEDVENFTQPLGVIGVLPGITATIQANEVIKIITGIGEILSGKLLLIDTRENRYDVVNII
jgi:adenylyltransferase/sulfurtransferase